jgi:hypothetical protein
MVTAILGCSWALPREQSQGGNAEAGCAGSAHDTLLAVAHKGGRTVIVRLRASISRPQFPATSHEPILQRLPSCKLVREVPHLAHLQICCSGQLQVENELPNAFNRITLLHRLWED